MVLRQYGPREAFGLVCDNAAKLRFYAARRFSALYRKTLGRLFLRANPRRAGKNDGKPHILYVTTAFEAFESQTVRYRVHNFRQALRGQAKTRFELIGHGTRPDDAILAWADLVVLMRTTWMPEVGTLLEVAKTLGVPVAFDIDDIIFLPEYAPDYCRVLGDSSKENLAKRRGEFEGFEKTFLRCGYATASTAFIAERMQQAGKCAYVIHNGLNKKQLNVAHGAKRQPNGERAIGYLSGTKTHDRDFAQVLPALEKIFAEYPDVVLRVAGYLDLSVLPPDLAARTRPACYMNWARLMKYGAQNYLNIAPLDIDNPFCHAKSELKYFEAAAVRVPTVASATDTFSRCIRNGKNGFVAATPEEWYASIKALLEDDALYRQVNEAAYAHALKSYAPQATAKEALAAYRAIIADFVAGGSPA